MDTPGLRPGLGDGPGRVGRQRDRASPPAAARCFGFKPAPSIKVATNTAMYRRMEEDMDINCGTILDGEATVEQVGERIFDHGAGVASGEKTKSEELGIGDNEFVPWQIGAVM